MPGALGDDPHRQAVARDRRRRSRRRRRARGRRRSARALSSRPAKTALVDRPVDLAPPDLVGGARLLDHELVVGRAAGVLAGVGDERAAGGDRPPRRAAPRARRARPRSGCATNGRPRARRALRDRCFAWSWSSPPRNRSRSDDVTPPPAQIAGRRRVAPREGLEPPTFRLTAERSTIELPRNAAPLGRPLMLGTRTPPCQRAPPGASAESIASREDDRHA